MDTAENDHLLNEQRWETFLSNLIPHQCRRPRGERVDKETPGEPSSISKSFATQVMELLKKENTGNMHDNSARFDYKTEEASDNDDDTDDDVIVISTENMPIALSLKSSSAVDRDQDLIADPLQTQHRMASMSTTTLTKRKEVDNLSDNVAVPQKYRKIESSTTQYESDGSERNDGVKGQKGWFKNLFSPLFPKIGNMKAETETTSPSPGQSLTDRSAPLKAVRKKQKPQIRPLTKKDVKFASKWDLSMFSRYIDFEEDVERLRIQTDCMDSSVTSEEMKTVVEETRSMFQTSVVKPQIEDALYKETNVRIFLTAILNKVCMRLNVGIKTDEQIEFNFLPSCKFDFLFCTRDGKPVGCMEAKTPSNMNNKAFVQSAIKLLVLQQLACKHDVDISAVPVFSILSDGQRFVFMQVKGEKLWLEHKTIKGDDILNIRTTKVMESIFRIVEMTLDCRP